METVFGSSGILEYKTLQETPEYSLAHYSQC